MYDIDLSALASRECRLLTTSVSLSSQSRVEYWVMFHTYSLLGDKVTSQDDKDYTCHS